MYERMFGHQRDILKGLLERVKPEQSAFFRRMYFPGQELTIVEMCEKLEPKKLSHAITQCENTIKDNLLKENPAFYDKNNVLLKNGDVIDLHQTVNGHSLFIVLDIKNFDVRYKLDFRKYEYDVQSLLESGLFGAEWEIIDNFFN